MKVSIYFFNITPKIIATKSAFDENFKYKCLWYFANVILFSL